MKEFCKKEIDFQVIKLNNTVDKMIEVMKASHQEVNVVDMSGVKEEMREMRKMAAEAKCGGGGGEDTLFVPPTREEEEEFISKRFIEGTTKGLKSRFKGRKMKM